jgi:nicotinate-nucleotide adenylyltransferase
MRIGVYVGSFDPIHTGHISVMNYLINNNYLDKIIILPTYDYWEKKIIANINDRINMIKLLNKDYLIVDNENNRFKYTYEILRVLNEKYKNDNLYLIISADNIVNFDKWKNVDEILLNNYVIVLNRENINIQEYTDSYKLKDKFIIIQDYPFINISSTSLRKKINKNYLDENVYKYILKNHLYGN